MSTDGGTRAVLAALVANLGIALSKFVAFAITGSTSMLAEAVHSVADSGNQVLLLIGARRGQHSPSQLHQFGYGRRRYVYAFVVSIILFLVGGLFSLYEGLHKVQHPEPLTSPAVAVAVLLIAIGLESWSLRTALGEANQVRGGHSLLAFVQRVRQPELPVVLLEDVGALVGLAFALVGVTLAVVTDDPRFDGLGAMAVGTLLVVIAVFLSFEMSSMLVGEAALPEEEAAVRRALHGTPGVDRVIHLRTLHTGPDELLVGVKVAVPADVSAAEVAATIDRAEQRVRDAVPTARWIYVEPDLDRGSDYPDAASTPEGN
jgi:cation diffusion facilitator family transporter